MSGGKTFTYLLKRSREAFGTTENTLIFNEATKELRRVRVADPAHFHNTVGTDYQSWSDVQWHSSASSHGKEHKFESVKIFVEALATALLRAATLLPLTRHGATHCDLLFVSIVLNGG